MMGNKMSTILSSIIALSGFILVHNFEETFKECLAGDFVIFSCKHAQRVKFTYRGGSLPENSIVYTNSLFIYDAHPNNSGLYDCFGASGGEFHDTTAELLVAQEDNSRVFPKVIIAKEGETQEFSCLSYRPTKWQQNYKDLKMNMHIVKNNSLFIEKTSISDEGIYECRGWDEMKNYFFSRARLMVVGFNDRVSPTTQSVGMGTQAVFRCISDTVPKWTFMDHDSLPENAMTNSNNVLVIPNMTAKSEGYYECSGQYNDLPFTSRVLLKLSMRDKDRVSPKFSKLLEGESVTLKCEASNIEQWKSGNKELPFRTNELKLESVGKNDHGVYTCIGSSSDGSKFKYHAVVIVLYRDQSLLQESSEEDESKKRFHSGSTMKVKKTLAYNAHFLLSCFSRTNPKWFHSGSESLPEGVKINSMGSLFIPEVKDNHAGEYRCEGVNENDEQVFASVQIIVIGGPLQMPQGGALNADKFFPGIQSNMPYHTQIHGVQDRRHHYVPSQGQMFPRTENRMPITSPIQEQMIYDDHNEIPRGQLSHEDILKRQQAFERHRQEIYEEHRRKLYSQPNLHQIYRDSSNVQEFVDGGMHSQEVSDSDTDSDSEDSDVENSDSEDSDVEIDSNGKIAAELFDQELFQDHRMDFNDLPPEIRRHLISQNTDLEYFDRDSSEEGNMGDIEDEEMFYSRGMVSPSSMTVDRARDAYFSCKSSTAVEWTKDDMGILPLNAIVRPNNELHVSKVLEVSEGVYYCEGTHENGTKFKAMGELNLESESEDGYDSDYSHDRPSVSPISQSIYSGMDAEFECRYHSNVEWEFNGGPLPGNVKVQTLSSGISLLTVIGATLNNAGIYTCASSSTGEEDHGELEVTGGQCDTLPGLDHGKLHHSHGQSVGDYAHYKCDPGYNMRGFPVRRCLDTGEWSGKIPECKFGTSGGKFVSVCALLYIYCIITKVVLQYLI